VVGGETGSPTSIAEADQQTSAAETLKQTESLFAENHE